MNASGMWFIDCTKRIDLIVHICSFPSSILKLVHLPFQILQQFVQVLKELLLKIKENILINQKHLLFVVPNTFSRLLFFILVRHHYLLRHLLRLPLGLSSTTAPPWTSTMVVYQVRRPKFHYWYWGEVAYFINNYNHCDFDSDLAFCKLFRYELSLLSPFELFLHLSYKRHFCC